MLESRNPSKLPKLQAIVDRVARDLDVDYALISVLTRGGTHFRSAALCARGGPPLEFELPLAGTPCATVLDRGSLHAATGLVGHFPRDRDLLRWGAQSYAAVAVRDRRGRALGHIAVLDSDPMPDPSRAYARIRALAGSVARVLARVVRREDSGEGPEGDQSALVRRLRAGDADAFDEFAAEYGERLLATARRIVGREEDAEDVVQEALTSALRALPHFEGGARFSTWVHRITVNAALMSLRARRRRREDYGVDADLLERTATNAAQPDEIYDRTRLGRRIAAGLDELTESARMILDLRVFEDLDTSVVAERLGLSSAAVKTRLYRARQDLRRHLPDREI